MLCSLTSCLKESEFMLEHDPESWHFKIAWLFFFATVESEKPLLKELWHAVSNQQEAALNSVFLCLELNFLRFLSGFLLAHECQSVVCRSHLFILDPQNQNNHKETTVIKTPIGPLALASYWLTLTY